MGDLMPNRGRLMAAEIAEAAATFAKAADLDLTAALSDLAANLPDVIYTIARGSSDAAANILSYEFMRVLGIPVTSLPPSIFSIGQGVSIPNALALIVSQSGASEDLVLSAKSAKAHGARVMGITNKPGSAVERQCEVTMPIGAGPELAVPATKSVIGSIGAGMSFLSALNADYAHLAQRSIATYLQAQHILNNAATIQASLLRASHVFVIGRDTGYGAAIEIALKLKECCALHAEAYSASEVLHGPMQLATNPLAVLILDTGSDHIQDSLDQAETRFRDIGSDVHRIRSSDLADGPLAPAAAAALLLQALYPVVLNTGLALGYDPDQPATLSKVTQTI